MIAPFCCNNVQLDGSEKGKTRSGVGMELEHGVFCGRSAFFVGVVEWNQVSIRNQK